MANWRPGQKEAVLAQAKARGMIESIIERVRVPAALFDGGGSVPATGISNLPGAKDLQLGAGVPKKKRAAHVWGTMNATEAEWSRTLDRKKEHGLIKEWAFEPCKFRLADNTTYTPDFISIPEGSPFTIYDLRRMTERPIMDAVGDEAMMMMIETLRDARNKVAIIDEIKGGKIWEKNRIKFKIAADKNPWFEWNLFQKSKDHGWSQLL